jgi:hypothetical protein
MKTKEIEQTISFLHNLQRWRKGADIQMPEPREVSFHLDNILRLLRDLRYHGIVSKAEVLKQVNIHKGAMIFDGYDIYESCIKYMNELEEKIEKL